MAHKVLILEDNEVDAALMEQYLNRSSHAFKVKWVNSGDEFEKGVHSFEADAIIVDYRLKAYSGLDAINYKNEHCKNIPLVIVSGTIGEEKAVELIKKGASDFLKKNSMANRLAQTVMRAINEAREKEKRQAAEFELEESEERFRMLFEHSLDGIIIGNPEGKGCVITANNAACEMLGYDRNEIKNLPLEEFIDIDREEVCREVEKRNRAGFYRGRVNIKRKDGTILPAEISNRILELQNGEKRSYYIIRDISERVKAEKKIQNSLKEKETLLTEIHHRVKNNLAVISGIMELQAMKSDHEELRNKLFDSQARIKSIAITHELLYEEHNFSSIDYGANIKKLVKSIASAMNTDVDFVFDLDQLQLDINQALPCSLILNEIITNAIRHAFNGEGKAVVNISMRKGKRKIHLKVRDNGKGLHQNFNLEDPQSIGFKLISILVKQLEGEMEINSNGGTEFHLTFDKGSSKSLSMLSE